MQKPFIVGVSGTVLTPDEISFLKDHKPWGIILFKRNCETPHGVYALTSNLRDIIGRTELPILIDQEGGRVARLQGSHWRTYPAPAFFYNTYSLDPVTSLEAVMLNASLQATELRKMGVSVNCTPMIDVRDASADDIIGDRAFSENPDEVTAFGQAVIKGLTTQGVLPIIKHIPGHGRSLCDSHFGLPVVCNPIKELERDFAPFKALNHAPMAMTAHIVYEALDKDHCATLSPFIIKHIIREHIGFLGILMSDDISMKALQGSLPDITTRSLDAGCDIILHCNGKLDEMQEIASVLPETPDDVLKRTDKMFADLHFTASPQQESDILEAYQEVTAKLLALTARKMVL